MKDNTVKLDQLFERGVKESHCLQNFRTAEVCPPVEGHHTKVRRAVEGHFPEIGGTEKVSCITDLCSPAECRISNDASLNVAAEKNAPLKSASLKLTDPSNSLRSNLARPLKIARTEVTRPRKFRVCKGRHPRERSYAKDAL